MKLTKKEKKILVEEIAQRCKDVVYMNAERQAKIIVNRLRRKDFDNPDDELTINYAINMVFGDLLQIVGRHRREKENK